jgi:hypothetical protein
VFDALARALHLDDAETTHLHDLARAAAPAGPGRKRPHTVGTVVRPGLQRLLDTIDAPAYISNPRKDFLAVNAIAHAVFSPIIDDPANQRNNARFTLLNPASQSFYRTGRRARTASSHRSASKPAATHTTAHSRPHRRTRDP